MTDVATDAPDRPVTISLKPHGGYDSPLIVVRGATVEEAANLLDVAAENGTLALLGKVDADLKAQYAAGSGLGAVPTGQPSAAPSAAPAAPPAAPASRPAPAGAQPPPGMFPDASLTCQHGARQYRTGQKGGRAWHAMFCPTPKGTPDQCSPVWPPK